MTVKTSGEVDEEERHVLTDLEHLSSQTLFPPLGWRLFTTTGPCTLSACYHEKLDLLALDLVAFDGY